MMFVFLYHAELFLCFRFHGIDAFYLPFYVNCFFIISGFLFYRKQLTNKKFLMGGAVLNILFRIAIPSVLFALVEFFPKKIIRGESIEYIDLINETIGGGTYWFTSALVVSELILLVLLFTRKSNIWYYAIICFVLGAVGMLIVKLNILNISVWAWRQGLISLIFLAMGGLYWKYEKQIDKLMRWWFVIPLLIVYFAMIFGLKGYNDALICYLTIQPLGVVTSAIASLIMIWVCKKLPEIRFLSFIGLNSIGFYFFSGALPNIYSILITRYSVIPMSFTLLIVVILSILTAYPIMLVLTSLFPWLFDLRLLRN